MQDFRNLNVWEKAHVLAVKIYRKTKAFPLDERYGLTSQLRRASVSIAANLAEGCGRFSPRDKAKFFIIAMGSASEVQHLLILSKDLGYICDSNAPLLEMEIAEIKKMLTPLIQKLLTAN
jgi:four helix bundle protein